MALTTVRPQGMGFVTGRRNLIINGAMQVAQRGTSETSVTTAGYRNACDRFRCGGNNGTWTISQDTDAPDGFSNSFKMLLTATETISSASYWSVEQRIEGQNLQGLAYGTSSAKTVTVSFYVKSNVTGTYCLNLYQDDGNQNFPKTYTIDSANTWERKTISFVGDTANALDNDNVRSLRTVFHVVAGSGYNSGTPGTRVAYTDATFAAGQSAQIDAVNDYWQITGLQLEVGENASDFEHRSFGEELALCQRYYEHSYPYGTAAGAANGGVGAMHLHAGASRPSGYGLVTTRYTVQKRAAATVTVYSYGGTSGQMSNGDSGANIGAVDVIQNGATSFLVRNNSGGTFSDQPIIFHYRGDAEL